MDANPVPEVVKGRLDEVGESYRSVGAIGGAALLVSVLMLIALPGVRGVPSAALISAVLAVVAYGVWGIAAGAIGGWWCRKPTPERVRRLPVVAALAILHFPFGTWAGVRTLWVLRRLAADPKAR